MIEFGCGDGNQLSLLQVPGYTGVDVSRSAVEKCRSKFKDDSTKKFVSDPNTIPMRRGIWFYLWMLFIIWLKMKFFISV